MEIHLDMIIENLGILLCRFLGSLLLIYAVSNLLPCILWGERAGWSTYSPMQRGLMAAIGRLFLYYLPSVVQTLAGLILLIFNRKLGRLLASGLGGHHP